MQTIKEDNHKAHPAVRVRSFLYLKLLLIFLLLPQGDDRIKPGRATSRKKPGQR
jgi:hypothetical protein